MNYAIQVDKVTKKYKNLTAVSDLSFEVEKAECFGFLGPNGAGKTTMMKMLYGKTRRDLSNGSFINVLGYDPKSNELEIKYLTGIVPQEDNLDVELSVIQNLKIYSKFYGLRGKDSINRILDLLDFMDLKDKMNSKIKELSGGMKRRLTIARSLINNPKLLILDEPTTGLDPQVRHHIWDKLRELKKQGVTILLTTHYMDEAFQICDNLIIMDKGKKILQGKPFRLIKDNIEDYVLEILNLETVNENLITNESFRIEKTENRMYVFSSEIIDLEKVTKNLNPGDFFLRQSNLEDLFLKTTGRSLNE